MTETSRFLHVGGLPVLDFLNTKLKENGQEVSRLQRWDDAVDWLREFGQIDTEAARWLQKVDSAEAREKALARVIEFRETVRGWVEAILAGKEIGDPEAAEVNVLLCRYPGYRHLRREKGPAFASVTRYEVAEAEAILGPFAALGADLLTKTDWSFLRRCENPDCILTFYDTSKNHTRRWCSMSGCGNRHKAARHYERVKAGRA